MRLLCVLLSLFFFNVYAKKAIASECPSQNEDMQTYISYYPVIVKGKKTAENKIEIESVYKGYRKENIPFDSKSVETSSIEVGKSTLILASFKDGKAYFDECSQFFSGSDFENASFYASLLAELTVYKASITAKINTPLLANWQTSQSHRRQLGEQYKSIIDDLKQSNDVLQILEFSRQSMQTLLLNAEDLSSSSLSFSVLRAINENENEEWATCRHDYEVESVYLPADLKVLLKRKASAFIKENPFTDYRYNPFGDYPDALIELGEYKAAINALCASESEYASLYLKAAINSNMPEIINGKDIGKPLFLSDIDLSNLFLKKMDLYSVVWNDVNVKATNLTNAKLGGGKFIDVNLSDSILDLATYNCETEFPAGFDPVKNNMIFDGPENGCEGEDHPSFNLDEVVIENFYDEPDNEYDEASLHIIKFLDGTARSAKLGKIDCFRCSIINSDFSDSQISLEIDEGEIRNTSFRNANLQKSSFSKMDLTNVNFTGADLRNTDFRGTLYDSKTKWPSGFDPIAAGAVKKAE